MRVHYGIAIYILLVAMIAGIFFLCVLPGIYEIRDKGNEQTEKINQAIDELLGQNMNPVPHYVARVLYFYVGLILNKAIWNSSAGFSFTLIFDKLNKDICKI